MTGALLERVSLSARHRYEELVRDLVARFRVEVGRIAMELEDAQLSLERIEDRVRRPEASAAREWLLAHESLAARVRQLESDLVHAREAVRGADEELSGLALRIAE